MIKRKKLFIAIFLVVFLFQTKCLSETLDELSTPQEPAYRLGVTDVPEIKSDFDIKTEVKTTVVQQKEKVPELISTPAAATLAQAPTYADLSIKKMSMEISKTLEIDYDDMLADLSLLWQGAATRSDTIKFAIYKLSNPEKDKPDSSAVKKVLTTIAGMSTFVGAGMGNPVLASAALIGGNTLGIMSNDTKALNYKYSKVNDADMIILVRKVEDLQQKVVDLYYEYMTARKLYDMTTVMVQKNYQNYQKAQNKSKEVILITDTFYRESVDQQTKARGSFFEKRSMLEQLVGNEVFREFENNVDKRER